jgi:hypothetical protein
LSVKCPDSDLFKKEAAEHISALLLPGGRFDEIIVDLSSGMYD